MSGHKGGAFSPGGPVFTCPLCGLNLEAKSFEPPVLGCDKDHHYTLGSLVESQALRAETLIRGAIRFLDEQENLIRAVLPVVSKPEEAAACQNSADGVHKIAATLRQIVDGENFPGPDLEKIKGSIN